MGKAKLSPMRGGATSFRQMQAKRLVSSSILNRATKVLSTVEKGHRGNIKVVVRVRPQNARETTMKSKIVVHVVDSNMVVFDPPDEESPGFYYKGVKENFTQGKRNKNIKFAFDNVYGPKSTNEQIFGDVINPMLDTLLNGFNCSVFAYGATGSGKTHTMIGSNDNAGLTFQTVMELYRRLEEMVNDYETEVTVSYLEVYNETIRDLLHMTTGDLQIREDANGVMVANLTTHKPQDSAELLKLLAQGNSVRSQHPTDHNSESSRSHAVFQVYIKLRSRFTELTSKYKSAKLVMVDLAGSEKGAATGFQGQRFREGASINRSLLSLGNCINALADGKKHISYRDSKLTRILKDSLGGNCKTVMIANVSPSALSYDDSCNTLKYADRAKRIKFQLKKNTMSVSACLMQYKTVVEEMNHTIESLKEELNELKSTYACKVEKVDASTATENVIQSCEVAAPVPVAAIATASIRSTLPPYAIQRINMLTKKRSEVMKKLSDASTASTISGTKIGMKERRIETIRKLKSASNTSKIQKQLEPLVQQREQAETKRNTALNYKNKMDEELHWYDREYSSVLGVVPISPAEFFEFQNLKLENDRLVALNRNRKALSEVYMDEWKKSESLLGDAVNFMSSQYLMSKHYKNNTRQMDVDYEKFAGSLCGTTVQWSTSTSENDGNINNNPVSRVPPLESFINDSALDEQHASWECSGHSENLASAMPVDEPSFNEETNLLPSGNVLNETVTLSSNENCLNESMVPILPISPICPNRMHVASIPMIRHPPVLRTMPVQTGFVGFRKT